MFRNKLFPSPEGPGSHEIQGMSEQPYLIVLSPVLYSRHSLTILAASDPPKIGAHLVLKYQPQKKI